MGETGPAFRLGHLKSKKTLKRGAHYPPLTLKLKVHSSEKVIWKNGKQFFCHQTKIVKQKEAKALKHFGTQINTSAEDSFQGRNRPGI